MEKYQGNILIVDDDPGVLQTAKFILKQYFTNVTIEKDPRKIAFLIQNSTFDVVLLDMNYKPGETSGKEGLELLKMIRSTVPETSVVMITAYGEIGLAVEAMKNGAVDFIGKPWENEKFIATITSVFQLSRSKKEIQELKTLNRELSSQISANQFEFVGESKPVDKVMSLVRKVAPTEANILILGENGTGKELIAKMIHTYSERSKSPFIKVDLGAITSSLFERELFGHVKGAFTDAKEDRPGRFELASGGTLFLDEIGNITPDLQQKLLSAIQNREIYRVGATRQTPVDIRLICATNLHLAGLVERREFREDLYYRLNTFEITMPPLRERKGDIDLLAKYYLNIYVKKYRKKNLEFTKESLQLLRRYSWPGNVRELEHTVERAVILAEDNSLKPETIKLGGSISPVMESTPLNLDEIEKKAIQNALIKHHGNMSRTAKVLGLGRTTLYRKLKKYGL